MVTVAIPFSRWGAQPYITHPFPFPIATVDALRAATAEPVLADDPPQHPIRLALEWQQVLASDPHLNMANIAETRGFSRARVTQVMNLLRLPEKVRAAILALDDPKQVRSLTERKLRPIVACRDTESQNRQVRELVAALGH